MKKETIATIFLLFATLLWGLTFAFIKDAMSKLSPFNFLFWRFGIASIFMFILFFKKINLSDKRLIAQGIWLGLFLAGTVIFQSIGLRYTTASTASFITGLSVVLVPLYFCLTHKQLPKANILTAVALSFLGIGLISLDSSLNIGIGDFWVLLCAICFSIYIIIVGKFSHSGDAISLTLIQSLTITTVVGVINLSTGGYTFPTQANLWVAILYCAIFASVLAFYLQIHYQRYVTATKTALIFAMEPVFATLAAIIYLNEILTAKFMIGALCILVGMLLSEIKFLCQPHQ